MTCQWGIVWRTYDYTKLYPRYNLADAVFFLVHRAPGAPWIRPRKSRHKHDDTGEGKKSEKNNSLTISLVDLFPVESGFGKFRTNARWSLYFVAMM